MEANNINNSHNINNVGYNYTPTNNSPAQTNQQEQLQFANNQNTSTPIHRLNGLDSTLLEKEAYRDIDDDAFKIEYKIEKYENEIKIINKQIDSAKALNDLEKVDMLNLKKHSIENKLKELYATYQGDDITRKLSNNITSFVSPKKGFISNIKEKASSFVSEKILSKISKRFNSGRDLKTALNKLENINQNVNELISHQAPYGEAEEKYDQLTKYLTKANTIQYQVSRELSKEGSKIKGNPFADQISKEKSEALAKKMANANSKKDTAQKNALNLNNNLKG